MWIVSFISVQHYPQWALLEKKSTPNREFFIICSFWHIVVLQIKFKVLGVYKSEIPHWSCSDQWTNLKILVHQIFIVTKRPWTTSYWQFPMWDVFQRKSFWVPSLLNRKICGLDFSPSLSQSNAEKLIQAFINARLYHCNSLLCKCPKNSLKSLKLHSKCCSENVDKLEIESIFIPYWFLFTGSLLNQE